MKGIKFKLNIRANTTKDLLNHISSSSFFVSQNETIALHGLGFHTFTSNIPLSLTLLDQPQARERTKPLIRFVQAVIQNKSSSVFWSL